MKWSAYIITSHPFRKWKKKKERKQGNEKETEKKKKKKEKNKARQDKDRGWGTKMLGPKKRCFFRYVEPAKT